MKKYVCNSNIFIYFCAQFESKQHQLVDNLIAKHPKSNTFREHPQGNRTQYTDTFHAKQAYSIYIPIARKYFNSQEYSHQSMNITEKILARASKKSSVSPDDVRLNMLVLQCFAIRLSTS